MPGPGRLFLVATPIGNLGDVSERAVQTLKDVAFIACEDTRHSRVLLDQYGIKKPLLSLPAFAEGERAGAILERLSGGEDGALITDAGSPAISDPGEKLVVEAVAAGITVVPIPGPAALIAALSASGLPTGRFHFLGFLPRQDSDARAMIEEVRGLSATLIFYESPRRLSDTLKVLHELLGDRRACVARELTKLHEELARGTLTELISRYAEEPKGECVVIVEGRTGDTRWSEDAVRSALKKGLAAGEKLKPLSAELSQQSGWSARDLYQLGLSLKS